MFDLVTFIKITGYLGIFAVIFMESGVLLGLFFPGDSLLFIAGFLASQDILDIKILCGIAFIAAVLGDSVGYMFGARIGPRIFKKEDSFFFNKRHIERAHLFYEKYGGRAVLIARFMPIVRTLAPIIAGVGTMKYRNFVFYNVLGAVLWAIGVSGLGYYLGSIIPGVDQYLIPIVIGIIALSFMPTIIHILRSKEDREALMKTIRRVIERLWII